MANGSHFSKFEPYRVKTVEKIKTTTRQEREKILREAHNNMFYIKADDVMIDLLTDSGTSAMSTEQWSALMRGEESYAGSPSYYRLEKTVKYITGYDEVMPTHQGRAAENILFCNVVKQGDIAISNGFFDTTGAHVQNNGGIVMNIPSFTKETIFTDAKFKGNIDISKLAELLVTNSCRVCFVIMTVTNNIGGGQPVSMANIRDTSAICKRYNVPLYFDACRYAENSYFIQKYEDEYRDKTIVEIAREMFSYGAGCTMSAKKDGLANIGGYLALRDSHLARECRQDLILKEGFPTYGGLSGREMETIAVGLMEALDEEYLEYRIGQVAYLGELLIEAGIRIVHPTGGHAVYVDATSVLPHIPSLGYPGVALCGALFLEGGIRAFEIGSLLQGKQPNGSEKAVGLELVRLCIPRRVYNRSHMRYVADVHKYVKDHAENYTGLRISWESTRLRHFTVKLEKISSENRRNKSDDIKQNGY
ncbi:tryptophanase-like [Saccoglossus kowalevskii]|uniref:Probable beta-eliminating lyase-like n=1 Tax=Saccoglossus kowalevskii TaxID=10224 RepID=A0ABM0GW90_SACKO|nr:PREDICTED: probable beta-eliminating lyase-like [Saccoglossus kowalevskii]